MLYVSRLFMSVNERTVIFFVIKTNFVLDITQFKHICYLCGTKMLQLYSVVKKHLDIKHDSMTIEFYTTQFKELIVQERAKQPFLSSQKAILEGRNMI